MDIKVTQLSFTQFSPASFTNILSGPILLLPTCYYTQFLWHKDNVPNPYITAERNYRLFLKFGLTMQIMILNLAAFIGEECVKRNVYIRNICAPGIYKYYNWIQLHM